MSPAAVLAVIMAVIWGGALALFLQFNRHGRFVAARLTWLSVVIGIGVDLVILLFVIPFEYWHVVLAVIAGSSLAIIARSIINESHDSQRFLRMKNERSESTYQTADSEQD